MSLEARVQVLEDRQAEWDKVLTGIEGTVALILQEQMDFKKQVDKRFEQIDKRFEQIDKRFEQIDKRFEQIDKRFDKIEETLILIVNRLPK